MKNKRPARRNGQLTIENSSLTSRLCIKNQQEQRKSALNPLLQQQSM